MSGKQSIAKLNQMNKAADAVKEETANLGSTKKRKEKMTVKLQCYVTPVEEKEFIDLIGRKPVSQVLRELIIDFTEKQENLSL